MMHLTDPEKQNLDQLAEAYSALAEQYTDLDNRPMHVPHAVHAFAHYMFHDVFENALFEHAREDVEARAAAGEPLDEDDVVGFNIEPVIRRMFEMLVMTGVEFNKRMHTNVQCRCIENVGDAVEQALWGGGCGR